MPEETSYHQALVVSQTQVTKADIQEQCCVLEETASPLHAPACLQNRLDNRQSYTSRAKRQQRKHANVRHDTAQDCEDGCRFALNLGQSATSMSGNKHRPGHASGAKQRDRKCCDTTRRKVQGTGCGRGQCCKPGPLAEMLPVQAKIRWIRTQQSGRATIMGAVWQSAHTWSFSRDGACSGSLSQALGKLLLALAANPPQTPCNQSSSSMVCLLQVV